MIETAKLGDPSLVYMYGLSDFWVDMFGDKQLVETLLAGETIQLAEAYSYFLQRAAGISLTDIQEKYETRIKLLLLSEEDLVDPSDLSTFNIDSSIVDISKLANRPVLPTQTLSYGIHFDIDRNILKLHKPINELKFPIRYQADGTWQYAIWMCDVDINEKWIDNTFGRLVGFTEEDALFNYKSFLEGVYFLYTNGPNLAYIVRGVNLAMGMPYARETEQVLDISQDEVTSNWVIFTSTYSYEIPYSYRPTLEVGDTLIEGEVLSTWVEIKDYSTSGAWWYQIYLPREVVGADVDPYELGKAVEGSTADLMMNNFLKHHMFEVLITQPSSDTTAFDTARDLVLRAKPEYTYPVFVWKASVEDELIILEDEFKYDYISELKDYCVSPPSIRYMDRSVEHDDFNRGTNWYNRVQGSVYAATLLGYGDWRNNAGWAPQFETVADNYLAYLDVLSRTRGDMTAPSDRSTINRGWRGHVQNTDDTGYPLDDTPEGITWKVSSDSVYGGAVDFEVNERNLTPLYMMSRYELITKMRTLDSRFSIRGRNKFIVTGLNLLDAFELWMVRNGSVDLSENIDYQFEFSDGDLDIAFSPFAYQTYVPDIDKMYDEDGLPIMDGTLLITRSTDSSWICQWVRQNISTAPTLFPIEDQDWTRAIEEYRTEGLGTDIANNDGVAINKDMVRVQTPRLVDGVQDLLITSDGLYVNTYDYFVEFENTQAEIPQYDPDDPATVELPILSRTFVTLFSPPDTQGYVAYDQSSTFLTTEETITPETDGTYIMSESPDREDILVISEGLFEFDYTIAGSVLTVNVPSTQVTVRYVSHRDEQVLPSGSTLYTLAEDSHCKIFVGSRLLEDWSYRRTGTTIELPSAAVEDLTVRYSSHDTDIRVSGFTRSTVETTQARFLMDRDRENGEYDDYLGQTVFMNRSGIPTLIDGSDADSVNVIRRLR